MTPEEANSLYWFICRTIEPAADFETTGAYPIGSKGPIDERRRQIELEVVAKSRAMEIIRGLRTIGFDIPEFCPTPFAPFWGAQAQKVNPDG